jgi:outer membrane lipoprotein-sorting protein
MLRSFFLFLHISILALCWQASPCAVAGETPSLKGIVERFDKAQAAADTLQGPFTLTIKRDMLQAPSVLRGTFYLSGSDSAHFAFEPPTGLVIHLTPKEAISYNPSEKKGELLKLGLPKVNRNSLALGRQLPFMGDYFKMEVSEPKDDSGSLLVTLMPRSVSLRRKMKQTQVWMDSTTYLPKRVQWVERSGDTWLFEFGQLQKNKNIPESVKNFAVPLGTPVLSKFSFFSDKKK